MYSYVRCGQSSISHLTLSLRIGPLILPGNEKSIDTCNTRRMILSWKKALARWCLFSERVQLIDSSLEVHAPVRIIDSSSRWSDSCFQRTRTLSTAESRVGPLIKDRSNKLTMQAVEREMIFDSIFFDYLVNSWVDVVVDQHVDDCRTARLGPLMTSRERWSCQPHLISFSNEFH